MSSSGTTDFQFLNKVGVTVASIKNQLAKADSLEAIDALSAQVADIESKFTDNRSAALHRMEEQRKRLVAQIDTLQQKLNNLSVEMTESIEWYKQQIKAKVLNLEQEIKNKRSAVTA